MNMRLPSLADLTASNTPPPDDVQAWIRANDQDALKSWLQTATKRDIAETALWTRLHPRTSAIPGLSDEVMTFIQAAHSDPQRDGWVQRVHAGRSLAVADIENLDPYDADVLLRAALKTGNLPMVEATWDRADRHHPHEIADAASQAKQAPPLDRWEAILDSIPNVRGRLHNWLPTLAEKGWLPHLIALVARDTAGILPQFFPSAAEVACNLQNNRVVTWLITHTALDADELMADFLKDTVHTIPRWRRAEQLGLAAPQDLRKLWVDRLNGTAPAPSWEAALGLDAWAEAQQAFADGMLMPRTRTQAMAQETAEKRASAAHEAPVFPERARRRRMS